MLLFRNHVPICFARDIILLCACRWFGEGSMGDDGKIGYDPSCKDAETEFAKYTYTELMLNTTFGLIVEGFGYHSFRLTEVSVRITFSYFVVCYTCNYIRSKEPFCSLSYDSILFFILHVLNSVLCLALVVYCVLNFVRKTFINYLSQL